MKQYSRVTYEDRCHISAWLETDISVLEISRRLKFHPSTIYREISRNKAENRRYRASTAHLRAKKRYRICRKKTKMRGTLKAKIIRLIKNDWSPDQISQRLKKEKVASISHECIYQYVRENKDELRVHLRRLNRRRGVGRYRQKGHHKYSFQPNISQRPESANNRDSLGHWERDIMFGLSKTPILVCVDRKSRLVKINRAENLKAKTINTLTLKLICNSGFKVKTVTSDRGTEFKVPLKGVNTFYCDPQAPQQRGTVENTIGLIRQYIKRNGDPVLLNNKYLKQIERKLNNRPRKTLDYRTPLEVVNRITVALAN